MFSIPLPEKISYQDDIPTKTSHTKIYTPFELQSIENFIYANDIFLEENDKDDPYTPLTLFNSLQVLPMYPLHISIEDLSDSIKYMKICNMVT